jgi:hypothetical protein
VSADERWHVLATAESRSLESALEETCRNGDSERTHNPANRNVRELLFARGRRVVTTRPPCSMGPWMLD